MKNYTEIDANLQINDKDFPALIDFELYEGEITIGKVIIFPSLSLKIDLMSVLYNWILDDQMDHLIAEAQSYIDKEAAELKLNIALSAGA